MKKILALVMALVMCFSLVACGGEEEPAAAPEAEETAAPAELEGAEDPVSDESFTALQEAYAQVVELYNAVIDVYSSDDVEADEDINALLTEAKSLIEQMGEVEREGMTEGDALDLVNAMSDIVDGLIALGDGMVGEAEAAPAEADGAAEAVSDESFTALQEAYAQMVELYNAVIDVYSSDEIEADEDVNNLLSQAKDLIEQIGEVDRAGMTETDALDLVNVMTDIVDGLVALGDAMVGE